jgi:deazaflavin-dependent oxidoreductase (nitroreductase family)
MWKDAAARFWTGLHEAAFRASNGLLFNRIGGMPVVMLTTTGRRSGRPRTTMLTSPVQDGDRLVLVASYGGDDRHPTWFLNLRANPRVEVLMDGRTRRMRARVAEPEERTVLWPRVTTAYWGYAQYQRQTTREIPLVILEPEPAQR